MSVKPDGMALMVRIDCDGERVPVAWVRCPHPGLPIEEGSRVYEFDAPTGHYICDVRAQSEKQRHREIRQEQRIQGRLRHSAGIRLDDEEAKELTFEEQDCWARLCDSEEPENDGVEKCRDVMTYRRNGRLHVRYAP